MSFAATLLIASLAAPGSLAGPVTFGTPGSFGTPSSFGATGLHFSDPKPITLQQILSAPYATSLTAAPTGNLFAWVEDAEGRHNLWISGTLPTQPPRASSPTTPRTTRRTSAS